MKQRWFARSPVGANSEHRIFALAVGASAQAAGQKRCAPDKGSCSPLAKAAEIFALAAPKTQPKDRIRVPGLGRVENRDM